MDVETSEAIESLRADVQGAEQSLRKDLRSTEASIRTPVPPGQLNQLLGSDSGGRACHLLARTAG